jgi:PAS domain S-box-containing protein
MNPDEQPRSDGAKQDAGRVSGRFLNDFCRTLERGGIPIRDLIGDLPIPPQGGVEIDTPIEWDVFSELLQRLDATVDGPAGLERCGEMIGELAPAGALRSLAGFAAAPRSLYQAATRWALPRAIPGIETHCTVVAPDRIEIDARLAEGLRPCSQIFHFMTGSARALPKLIGSREAVVAAEIGEREAHFRISLPPSATLGARIGRCFRTIFSAGSALRSLELQQLELRARNEALKRAHDALVESERRFRVVTDTAADVLCELDEGGRFVYVSASIQDLIGYSAAQVAGSHYRLWIPREVQDEVGKTFERLKAIPTGRAVQELVSLHVRGGGRTVAEVTGRSYETPDGEWRLVCSMRDVRHRHGLGDARRPSVAEASREQAIAARPLKAASGRLKDVSRRLEAVPEETTSEDMHPSESRTAAAAARLTQEALIEAVGRKGGRQWLELHKLLRAVHDAMVAKGCGSDLELQIDLADAPSEVWGEESLLTHGLASLLEFAAACTPPGENGRRRLELGIRSVRDRGNGGRIVFRLAREAGSETPIRPVPMPGDPAAEALAIAGHFAEALDGRVSTVVSSPARATAEVCRMELPMADESD